MSRRDRVEPRSIRPVDDADTPNQNPPGVPPASVGGADYTPGDPAGLVVDDGPPAPPWPRSWLHASPWDGWPAEWNLPAMGQVDDLADMAWAALDLNASVFSTMPPYLVGASGNLPDEWLDNPDPYEYTSWATFAHGLMWDFQLGEAFVVCTSRYANGWPACFHLVEPWMVNVEFGRDGHRQYRVGDIALDGGPGGDLLHIRYRSTVSNARGTGPLDAGRSRLVAARVLLRYMTNFILGGAVPSSILESPDEITAKQASDLQAQWLNARMSNLGLPAVIGGGVTWRPTEANPLDTALVELAAYTEAKIPTLLGVPPALVGLPSGQDSLTYNNQIMIRDQHWQGGLKPKASRLMLALSQWLVPRGTSIEVNRDEYVRPGPLERAQTWDIYLRNGVVTVDEVRQGERFDLASRTAGSDVVSGVLK